MALSTMSDNDECRNFDDSSNTLMTSDRTIEFQIEQLVNFLRHRDQQMSSTSFSLHRTWFVKVFKIFKQSASDTDLGSTYLYCFALKYLSLLIKATDKCVAFSQDNNHLTDSEQDIVNESLFYRRTFVDFCGPLFEELLLKFDCPRSSLYYYMKTAIFCFENFIGTDYAPVVRDNIFIKYSIANLLVQIQDLPGKKFIFLRAFMNMHILFDYFTAWDTFMIEDILKLIGERISKRNVLYHLCLNYTCAKAIKYANIINTHLATNINVEKELIIIKVMPLRKFTELLTCTNSYAEPNKFIDSTIMELGSMFTLYNTYNSDMRKLIEFSLDEIMRVVCVIKQETLDYLITVMSMVTNKLLHSDKWLSEDENDKQYLMILPLMFECWSTLLKQKLYFGDCTNYELLVPLIHNNDLFFDNSSSELLKCGLQLITNVLKIKINIDIFRKINLKAYRALCSTLKTKLFNSELEMRKHCLQCILSLVGAIGYQYENNNINIILDEELPIKVFKVFKTEDDPSLRIIVLKCLEKMVSVPEIWNRSLSKSDLISLCLMFVQCEMDGSVRVQLVSLITVIIMFPEIIGGILFYKICKIMVHVSIKDPICEVRKMSYKFWEFVIDTLIIKQNGITKPNANIAKLRDTGCIHVLYVALKNEKNFMIKNEVNRITSKLIPYIMDYTEVTYFNSISDSESTDYWRGLANNNLVTNPTTSYDLKNIYNRNADNIYLIWQPDYKYISIDDFLNLIKFYISDGTAE